jgi:nucleoside-diphosphate-sugar epimerase
MRILVTGNMGYVGPAVIGDLRGRWPDAELIGFDAGYFGHCLTNAGRLPETLLDAQYFGDVRSFPPRLLQDVDAVVHLAAISNDPMGNTFERVTKDVNHGASIALAKEAKAAGVKRFVFASSCSVYGSAEDGARNEHSPVNPLTAYARSKVLTEQELAPLQAPDFVITCLRFATACGMSARLRLDLVLNDFVASAVAAGRITVLSDGSPWRPLIHLDDMARAIAWAISREPEAGGNFLVVNTGSNEWNYQVKALAHAVGGLFPNVVVSINEAALPDRRSYQVDFSRFQALAPQHRPVADLKTAILGLRRGLEQLNFRDQEFRKSSLVRLNVLAAHRKNQLLDEDLRWTRPSPDGHSVIRQS